MYIYDYIVTKIYIYTYIYTHTYIYITIAGSDKIGKGIESDGNGAILERVGRRKSSLRG